MTEILKERAYVQNIIVIQLLKNESSWTVRASNSALNKELETNFDTQEDAEKFYNMIVQQQDNF